MAYTPRSWINKSAVDQLRDLQKRFGLMASEKVIEEAAHSAGGTLRNSMQTMIRAQPALSGYGDVSEGLTTWRSKGNVQVGLPPGHKLVDRANQMEQEFPLREVCMDMERQTGDTSRSFYTALAKQVGL